MKHNAQPQNECRGPARADWPCGGWRRLTGIDVRMLVIALALVSISAATVRLAAAADALDHYRLAVGFYKKEQWKLAAESFRSFLDSSPRHPRAESARFYYGLSLVKLDDLRQAREVLRRFVHDFPKSRDVGTAGYWVGHCSFFLQDYPAAEHELAAFLSQSPQDPLGEWALPYLADAELRQQKAAAAQRHFDEALKAFPNGALADDVKFGLARSYELLRQNDVAQRLYREVSDDGENPHAAEARLNLGGLLFDSGRYADAAAAYASLLERFPASSQAALARLNLGFAQYQLGDYRRALGTFEESAAYEKYAGESQLWQGLSLKALQETAQAAAVFEAAYEKFREQPVAEKLLFQWADCRHRLADFDRAQELFVEVGSRFPKGELADESLHRACAAAVAGEKLPEAETLLARFDRDFPGNKLRFRQEILKGRVLAARSDLAGAEQKLRGVIAASEIESTTQQARYYLADVLQKARRPAESLEVSEPLAALWNGPTPPADLAGIFVLRGASQLALARDVLAREQTAGTNSELKSRCAQADESAANYLHVAADGALADQARGLRVVAAALAGDKPGSMTLLKSFRDVAAGKPEFAAALNDLAAIAFSRHDFEWSEALYGELAAATIDRPAGRSRALADLAWSQFKLKKFDEAAATFGKLVDEVPDDALASEAGFMRASSLQEAGKIDAAQAAYAQTFRLTAQSEHVFLAGLQSARMLVRLQRTLEADTAYNDLLKRFGRRNDADKVLDEWATIHYNAEDYAKADELFRRLAEEYPQSALADNARLCLAESDLIAGRIDAARAGFDALSAGSGSDAEVQQRALFQLMQLELDDKKWERLRKVCRESLQRFPKGTYRRDAEWKWAEAEFYAGDYQAALERLTALKNELGGDAALGKAVWLPQMWVLLAETHFRQKDYDAVAATVAAFRESDGQNALMYQAEEVLGRSLKAQAKWDEARTMFDRAIHSPEGRQTATAAKCQFLIADSYHHEKKYEDALREYLKVDILYKYPEWQAPALHGAGLCLENLQRLPEAARTYDDLLHRFPTSDVAGKARERLDQLRKRTTAS